MLIEKGHLVEAANLNKRADQMAELLDRQKLWEYMLPVMKGEGHQDY